MCKFCYFSLLLLLLIIGVGIYKFLVQGTVVPSSDGRIAVVLSEGERDLVLKEMRGFLIAIQQITSAVIKEDMDMAVTAAKKVGMAAQTGIPASLIRKIPLEFKKLGFSTHTQFDQLALDAEQLGDQQHVLQQLSELMNNCVGCHAAYRLVAQPGNASSD